MIKVYFQKIHEILDKVENTQKDVMQKTAKLMADCIDAKKNIYVFGCSHAGLLAQEMFYRTGGLAVVNPILPPGLMLNVRPVTLTTELERLDGYATAFLKSVNLGKGDILIIHSVSGRNAVTIEMAIEAKKSGATVIGLTNVAYSKSVPARHSSGKNLYQWCDIVIDNCGDIGDSVCEIDGFSQKVAASSTAVGAAILNAILAETVDMLVKRGLVPPVFISANVEGGDEHNHKILDEYKDNIKYL